MAGRAGAVEDRIDGNRHREIWLTGRAERVGPPRATSPLGKPPPDVPADIAATTGLPTRGDALACAG